MEGILALIGFGAILMLIDYINKTRYEDGYKLKKFAKPYYDAIMRILLPYKTTEFYKKVVHHSQELLKGFEKNSHYDYMVEHCNDNFFVECFALVYLYCFKPYDACSEEEYFARKSIKDYCFNKLLRFGKEIPKEILDDFEIDINTLKKENNCKNENCRF